LKGNNQTISSCTTAAAAPRSFSVGPVQLNGTTVYLQEVTDNMAAWADDLANLTLNKDAQHSMTYETLGSPSMFYTAKWRFNPTFFTQCANIDWSGYSVITMSYQRSYNEWGYAKPATIIGIRNFIASYHYSTSNNTMYLDINGSLQTMSTSGWHNPNGTVASPTSWDKYSDACLGTFSANIPATVGVFPVLDGTFMRFNTELNASYSNSLSVWAINTIIDTADESTKWANMLTLGSAAQVIPSVFNPLLSGNLPPAYVPVYRWTAKRELVLQYAPYDALFKPAPRFIFYIWLKTMTPTAADRFKNVYVNVPLYKSQPGCLVNCTKKGNIQRGMKDGDSGGGAFIIVSGQPIFVGSLHYGYRPYQAYGQSGYGIDTMYYAPYTAFGAIHSFAHAYKGVYNTLKNSGRSMYLVKFCGFRRNSNLCPAIGKTNNPTPGS